MFSQRLSLHDVRDVEALCGRVLDERLKRFGAHLRPDVYEDALAYLLAEAWKLSLKWNPAKGSPAFSTFAYRRLRFARGQLVQGHLWGLAIRQCQARRPECD